jgi:periplasmic protein CpxP/Spy
MNKKALFLLPGALMLMFAASPLISSLTNPAVAQNAPTKGQHERGDRMGARLNLTADQKAKIKGFRDAAKLQMDGILTADQKALLLQAKQTHQRPKLNLTADQKASMKKIRESTETQIKGILNADQLKQWEAMHQERQERHQQHKKS